LRFVQSRLCGLHDLIRHTLRYNKTFSDNLQRLETQNRSIPPSISSLTWTDFRILVSVPFSIENTIQGASSDLTTKYYNSQHAPNILLLQRKKTQIMLVLIDMSQGFHITPCENPVRIGLTHPRSQCNMYTYTMSM
jgi:hypothetical protein